MEMRLGMEMEEIESTWKGLFQRRVVMAAKHCQSALEQLSGVVDAVDADVEERRHHQGPSAEAAQRGLECASMELGLAIASIGAARHLALRGAAPCPSAPLDSVDDLAGDPAVWLALKKLGGAAELATRVHDAVECARGHLLAAELLVVLAEPEAASDGDDSTVPWKQKPWNSEQLDGCMHLAEAQLKATDLATATADAREAAFGLFNGVE